MAAKDDLLIRIAELYYQQEINQKEIAKIIGTSRPTVSRLLEEAKEAGVVEIKVHSPLRKDPEMSAHLRTALHLKDVVVVAGDYGLEKGTEMCGMAAAHFLNTIMENNKNIGITWGSPIREMIKAMPQADYYNVTVIQMTGCLGTGNPDIDGLELALQMSQKLGGAYSNIYAPAFVDNELVYSYLINQPQIAATLEKANHVDLLFTGIGSVTEKSGSLQRAGLLTEKKRMEILARGGVGHLSARFYDQNGIEIPLDHEFTISAPLSAMRSPKWSVGIAVGESKLGATLGAVKGGFINTLIIDQRLAGALAERLETHPL